MFNLYPHFANTPPEAHPGQPVHSEKDFDVFQDKGTGEYFVIPEGGEPVRFPPSKLEEVKHSLRQKLAALAPLSPEQLAERARRGPPLHQRYRAPSA